MLGSDQPYSTGSETTAIYKPAGRCHPDRGQSRKSSGEWKVKFAGLVVVVFVEGARLDLSTMIARHKLLNLKGSDIGGKRARRNSYRKRC